jgi:uncharacterized cupredoxin-like copper-binding protein
MLGHARRSHTARVARAGHARRGRWLGGWGSFVVAAPTAVLFLATACGAAADRQGGGAGAGGVQQVTVVAQDTMRFTPSALTVQAGKPVRLVLRNEGALVHDITLRPGPAGSAKPVRVAAAGRGAGSATFTPAASGTYPFVCSQAGHEAAGMTGALSAVAAAPAIAAGSSPAR